VAQEFSQPGALVFLRQSGLLAGALCYKLPKKWRAVGKEILILLRSSSVSSAPLLFLLRCCFLFLLLCFSSFSPQFFALVCRFSFLASVLLFSSLLGFFDLLQFLSSSLQFFASVPRFGAFTSVLRVEFFYSRSSVL
jgi:hypothetical protein